MQGNNMDREVRFARSARKHRIGRAHVIEAMNRSGEPVRISAEDGSDDRLLWIGEDDRGVTLEIIGLDLRAYILIIHVMPYGYRRR